MSPTRNHISHCSDNGNAAECMRAGVTGGKVLFPVAVRDPRMRIDSSTSIVTVQKTKYPLRYMYVLHSS